MEPAVGPWWEAEPAWDPSRNTDTGWLEDLPVFPCPGPPENATVVDFGRGEGLWVSMDYWAGVDAAPSFQLHARGFNVSVEGCPSGIDHDLLQANPDLYYMDLLLISSNINPNSMDPMKYQGFYSLNWPLWWYHARSFEMGLATYDLEGGYHYDLAQFGDGWACISRLRPGRVQLSMLVVWPPDEIAYTGWPPFYLTFDVRADELGSCWGVLYSIDATYANTWGRYFDPGGREPPWEHFLDAH